MATLEQHKKDRILLAEAGFIAVSQSDEDAAMKLFKASELLEPENPLAKIGMGYLHLCKLDLKTAAKLFQDILNKDPSQELAKALLGLTYALNPNECEKGEDLLSQMAHSTKDGEMKKLAKDSVEFVRQFVKKTPTPAQAPMNKGKK